MPNANKMNDRNKRAPRLSDREMQALKQGRSAIKSPSGLGAKARARIALLNEERSRKNAPNPTMSEMDRWNKYNKRQMNEQLKKSRQNAPKY